MLVLGHQRGSGHLGDHEAGVQAGARSQERRQVERQNRVHHQGDAALRDRPDLGQGQRNHVGGKAHGFSVEVTTGHDQPGPSQHQRIVGCRVGLDHQSMCCLTQNIHRGSGDLWLAPDAIRVLNARIAHDVAFADFRTR